MRTIRGAVLAGWLVSASAAVLVTTTGCGSAESQSRRVDSARAHELVAQGATLLDVRTEGEWSEGHLAGAIHVPVQELDSRMSEVPHDHPVVVYCLSGGRSARAAAALAAAGYDVYDLGAMANW
ncbi:MAG: rhodanese-like domain-containing protein [Sandaracinus sp.]